MLNVMGVGVKSNLNAFPTAFLIVETDLLSGLNRKSASSKTAKSQTIWPTFSSFLMTSSYVIRHRPLVSCVYSLQSVIGRVNSLVSFSCH